MYEMRKRNKKIKKMEQMCFYKSLSTDGMNLYKILKFRLNILVEFKYLLSYNVYFKYFSGEKKIKHLI